MTRCNEPLETHMNPSSAMSGDTPDSNGQLNVVINQLESRRITCYYMPGKVHGKSVQYLLDTGCTRSVLSKRTFDRLPAKTKEQLQPNDLQGIMADGSILPMLGKITLACKLRNEPFEETFIVSKITDDAILGMSFLEKMGCTLNFDRHILNINDKELLCVDRTGTLLSNKVQILKDAVIPASTEQLLIARITSREAIDSTGIVEGQINDSKHPGLIIASSLCNLGKNNQVYVHCCNINDYDINIKAGTIVGTYFTIDNYELSKQEELKLDDLPTFNSLNSQAQGEVIHFNELPKHVQPLYENAAKTCPTEADKAAIARLLKDNADIFSQDDCDMG